MSNDAIEASSVRCQTMADSTLRLVIDIEPRFANAAFQMFGKVGTPMAIVALKVGHALPESDVTGIPATEKPKGGVLSQDAARICQTPEFQAYVAQQWKGDAHEEVAAQYVRAHCQIKSRAELDHDPRAARLFSALMTQYRESQHA